MNDLVPVRIAHPNASSFLGGNWPPSFLWGNWPPWPDLFLFYEIKIVGRLHLSPTCSFVPQFRRSVVRVAQLTTGKWLIICIETWYHDTPLSGWKRWKRKRRELGLLGLYCRTPKRGSQTWIETPQPATQLTELYHYTGGLWQPWRRHHHQLDQSV